MDETTIWLIGVGVAAVVVVIAAGLLLAVLAVAKNIETGAAGALGTVKKIRENTQVIWQLEHTNYTATQLRDGAKAILGNAGQIAQALHEADERRGDSA